MSIYLPDPTGPATYHLFGEQANYLTTGNHVSDTSDAAFRGRSTSWYFLDGVEVLGAYKRAGVVVAYGDSITDGVGIGLRRQRTAGRTSWPAAWTASTGTRRPPS